MRNWSIAAAIVTVATGSMATAQVQGEQPKPPVTSPPAHDDCSAGPNAPRPDETTGSKSLSERLSESKGVICPPAGVDSGVAVPPITGGRMPVIPPPGTPGGDPHIQPK